MGKRSAGRALVRAATVLVLACWAAFAAVAPAAADDGDLIKVFVVSDVNETGGQLPTLPSIAGSTLDDPARAGEILDLNRGRTQPDGGALTRADDRLHPGWILRLPQDASGPDVRLARETGNRRSDPPPRAASGDVISIPLPAVLAVLAAVLVALVTAAIAGRRRLTRWIARAVHALGEPARRRRRLSDRLSLGRRFATDGETLRRAYDTIGEVAVMFPAGEGPVHAVSVDRAGTTVWLPASESLATPWQRIDSTRWRRMSTATARSGHGDAASQAQRVRNEQMAACMVRAGSDAAGEPVFVDLSRLDGVLSVTGDRRVAREIVQNLLWEIARVRPGIPVAVLRTADAGIPLAMPPGLAVTPHVPVPVQAGDDGADVPIRGAAARRPVRALVVVLGTPDERDTARLLALCGTNGVGWTGLVCGDIGEGAHWRWHATSDGTVDVPVLGMELTVPARPGTPAGHSRPSMAR
ncbi:hypothetical protein [Actinoplanes sp. NPDC049681]|uniref:hypothetical protein n=1 Tax=Actinoplanes sp. NPDC049681 TaxID=3363905 RepID=UPI0037A25C49